MLHTFLDGLGNHLTPHGEAWLILSDLAEHLALRTTTELHTRIADTGLHVTTQRYTAPTHRKHATPTTPLHRQRSKERTTLWHLTQKRNSD